MKAKPSAKPSAQEEPKAEQWPHLWKQCFAEAGTFPTDVASNGAFPHFATLGFGNQFRHLPVGMTLR